MLSRRITSADLAAIGQVDRHRLRNLLKDIPEFAARPANERVAIEYTRHDLTVVAVLCELERIGLRKEAIARWVSPIQQALMGPLASSASQLKLTFDPPAAALGEDHTSLRAGIVLDLGKILHRVDSHCTGIDDARAHQGESEFASHSVKYIDSISQPRALQHG